MFTLTIHDTAGIPLNIGDWVQLNNIFGRLIFYVPVELLGNGRISPFDTFSFNSAFRIDQSQIPPNAQKVAYGFVQYNADLHCEYTLEDCQNYLLDIRQLEHNRATFYSISAV